MSLAVWRRRSGDKARVEQTLRSWDWDGLKARMSNCAFSSYVGISLSSEIFLPPQLERSWEEANMFGLGPEFIQALVAEATLDGVMSLLRLYQLLNANALYIAVARRAFTCWAGYKVLSFEHEIYRHLSPRGWSIPGCNRSLIPACYHYTFRPRWIWDIRTRVILFDMPSWPRYCGEPFWAALYPREAIPMMRARFEPERFPQPAPAVQDGDISLRN
jgi:hypothetical protein